MTKYFFIILFTTSIHIQAQQVKKIRFGITSFLLSTKLKATPKLNGIGILDSAGTIKNSDKLGFGLGFVGEYTINKRFSTRASLNLAFEKSKLTAKTPYISEEKKYESVSFSIPLSLLTYLKKHTSATYLITGIDLSYHPSTKNIADRPFLNKTIFFANLGCGTRFNIQAIGANLGIEYTYKTSINSLSYAGSFNNFYLTNGSLRHHQIAFVLTDYRK